MERNDRKRAEQIEREIAGQLLTEREKILMNLLFDDEAGEKKEKIRTLTENFDLDASNLNYSLMLAILGIRTGWKGFPASIVPRLKGIHRYCQAKNAMGMPWLLEQIRKLREKDIPVMMLKGLALRYYYIPEMPRVMHDYDIAVPRDRFEEAIRLLNDGKVPDNGDSPWATSIVGKVADNVIELDVHQWIFKNKNDRNTAIWDRAIPVKLFDLDVLVPCREDMFIHQLNNHATSYFVWEMADNRMKWLFDCRMIQLSDEKPDPEKVFLYANQLQAQYTTRFMLSLYASCFDDQEAMQLAEMIQPMTKGYAKWLKAEWEFHEEIGRYNSYGYVENGPLDVKRAYRTLRKTYKKYQVYRNTPDLYTSGISTKKKSFVRFIAPDFQLRDIPAAVKRYTGRLLMKKTK